MRGCLVGCGCARIPLSAGGSVGAVSPAARHQACNTSVMQLWQVGRV